MWGGGHCSACAAGCCVGGWGVGLVVWFGYTARPPPPVILPAAAGAALRLGGALRRASPFGLALPRVFGKFVVHVSVWRGAEKGAIWGGVDVASDNRQDSNHPRLAASSEARLAWSKLASASDHLCKPSRSTQPRVAPFSAPRYLRRQRGQRVATSSRAGMARSCEVLRPSSSPRSSARKNSKRNRRIG